MPGFFDGLSAAARRVMKTKKDEDVTAEDKRKADQKLTEREEDRKKKGKGSLFRGQAQLDQLSSDYMKDK